MKKVCGACRKRLPAKRCFWKSNATKDGFQGTCKDCSRGRCRERDQNGMTPYQRYARRLRLKVLRHYGGEPPSCACLGCDETRFEFLAIDHVDGGGRKHRQEITGGIYRWLVRSGFPDGYRVLCHNCNQALGNFGYCPHQRLIDVESVSRRKRKTSGAIKKEILDAADRLEKRGVYPSATAIAKESGMGHRSGIVLKCRSELVAAGLWPHQVLPIGFSWKSHKAMWDTRRKQATKKDGP